MSSHYFTSVSRCRLSSDLHIVPFQIESFSVTPEQCSRLTQRPILCDGELVHSWFKSWPNVSSHTTSITRMCNWNLHFDCIVKDSREYCCIRGSIYWINCGSKQRVINIRVLCFIICDKRTVSKRILGNYTTNGESQPNWELLTHKSYIQN